MRLSHRIVWLVAVSLLFTGCQNYPQFGRNWAPPGQPQPQQQLAQQQQQYQQQLAQRESIQRQASQLDSNNRDLHTQLAQSQQQLRLLQDEVGLLRTRLGETADHLATARQEKELANQQLASVQTTAQRRGGAVITANSSFVQELPVLNVPGVNVRQDGDVVRIELPSDSMFLPNSATLHQGAFPLIDPVVESIKRSYPQQIVGIEGHCDSEPLLGSQFRNKHQLSVAQALAVFDQFNFRHQISPNRLFVLGHGSNHPIDSNVTPSGKTKNRRIELVIYPNTPETRTANR